MDKAKRIIYLIEQSMKFQQASIDKFHDELHKNGIGYATKWYLSSAVRAEFVMRRFNKYLTFFTEADIDVEAFLRYITREKTLLTEQILNGSFIQSSSSRQHNANSIYRQCGAAYLIERIDILIDLIENN